MASLNEVTLIGFLGADPECRVTATGVDVVTLRVATTDTWKDKESGEKKEATEWHRVVVFGKPAEFARLYLKKGAFAFVRGAIRTRKWTNKEGADVYTTEIIADTLKSLDRKGEGSAKPPGADKKPGKTKSVATKKGNPSLAADDALDDTDIPEDAYL